MGTLIYYLLIVNVASFTIYGIDKWKAKRGAWRIPEHILIVCAIIGGSGGAALAMLTLRHKTKHAKFYILIPLILLSQLALLIYAANRGFFTSIH